MGDSSPTPSNPETLLPEKIESTENVGLPEVRLFTSPTDISVPVSESTPNHTEVTEDAATGDTTNADSPTRPILPNRKSSETMIVSRDHPSLTSPEGTYNPSNRPPPMSPPRPSDETEELGQITRTAIEQQAKSLQSGLTAIAEKIEVVKSDHDKLEKQNNALQDYISDVTRTLSSSNMTSGKGKK